jgi:hypothetical protein
MVMVFCFRIVSEVSSLWVRSGLAIALMREAVPALILPRLKTVTNPTATGLTEKSDSRRILTSGSFSYVEM